MITTSVKYFPISLDLTANDGEQKYAEATEEEREEMCTKWMVFGSFYPFMRNHNAKTPKDQDPAVFSPDHHEKVKQALELRYSLLPELHHLFYKSHLEG